MQIVWHLRTQDWAKWSEASRDRYCEIVTAYGGSSCQAGDFALPSYRRAEVCARSLSIQLGVRTPPEFSLEPAVPAAPAEAEAGSEG
jgi:hypothetical protein